jgi:FKBP-type peptidyl-prolyl cis-trans isomerase
MKLRFPTLLAAACALAASAPILRAQDSPDTAPAAENDAAQPDDPMLQAPDNVDAPPEDAKTTDSGLASIILEAGEGGEKPVPSDTVTVHYTGWTTDGKMFDSSVKRGEPTSFPLNGVIAGWTEGVQLMSVGEKRRFWIPAELAYGEKPGGGRPGGMLVFDIELLDIKEPAKPPEDAEKTAAGVAYKVLSEGEGKATPEATDLATFHFTASTMEGQTVQDTRRQPQAPTAPLDKLPPELGELLGEMKPGEQRRAWLPEPQAPGGFIVADLELVSYREAEPAPPVPDNVGAVPEDAEKTDSGLASVILSPAEKEDRPAASDTVKVHYTGWTTDGEMFDSSVTRGEPTTFPLSGVIPGWTEGVQLMSVGEKRRFWVPAALAYGENPGGGRPGGMLVFDIELLEIVR